MTCSCCLGFLLCMLRFMFIRQDDILFAYRIRSWRVAVRLDWMGDVVGSRVLCGSLEIS